jgi:hypothetical protein
MACSDEMRCGRLRIECCHWTGSNFDLILQRAARRMIWVNR